jgi:hypothetical protein
MQLSNSRPANCGDHDRAGRDPNAHLEGLLDAQLADRFDEHQPRSHGVVLMGLGVPEIRQHTVAHVLGDETAVALDQLRAAPMIGADDLPQFLRVEPALQGSRAHKVAEHNGELAAFSGVFLASARSPSEAEAWPGQRPRTRHLLLTPYVDAEQDTMSLALRFQQVRWRSAKRSGVLGHAKLAPSLKSAAFACALAVINRILYQGGGYSFEIFLGFAAIFKLTIRLRSFPWR